MYGKIKKLLFVALAVVALPLSGCAGHEPDTQVDTEQKDLQLLYGYEHHSRKQNGRVWLQVI